MSDVEKMYYALAPRFGNTTKWENLPPEFQMQFVQGINMIIAVLNARVQPAA